MWIYSITHLKKFANRCGIGKSTFIHTFMHCCIGDSFYDGRHRPQGLLVITDSIKRLEELSSTNKDRIEAEKYWGEIFKEWGIEYHYKEFEKSVIVLRSDEPFKEQLIKQHYKPIVLLSTQRYFMLGDNIREQLFSFTYNGETLKRDIVIVEVGDIVMQGVNDVETFGKQLREEICKGGKTTECITEAISSTQLGKGIGKAKLYK